MRPFPRNIELYIYTKYLNLKYSTFYLNYSHNNQYYVTIKNQIQASQGACRPGSTRCGKNFGVAVRSGKRGTEPPETRKEIQMVIRKEGKDPKVLKCQEGETYKVTANEQMDTFIVSIVLAMHILSGWGVLLFMSYATC